MTPNLPNGVAPRGQLTGTSPAAPADAGHRPDVATAASRLRSQSAQESLGLPAGNGLLAPFIQAGIVTAILLAALTVGPYQWEKSRPAPEKAAKPTDKPEAPAPSTESQTTPSTNPSPSANVSKEIPGKPPAGKAAIVKKLGENEAKAFKPSVNPLDKKDDDLLKDIK